MLYPNTEDDRADESPAPYGAKYRVSPILELSVLTIAQSVKQILLCGVK